MLCVRTSDRPAQDTAQDTAQDAAQDTAQDSGQRRSSTHLHPGKDRRDCARHPAGAAGAAECTGGRECRQVSRREGAGGQRSGPSSIRCTAHHVAGGNSPAWPGLASRAGPDLVDQLSRPGPLGRSRRQATAPAVGTRSTRPRSVPGHRSMKAAGTQRSGNVIVAARARSAAPPAGASRIEDVPSGCA